jgi:acyl dehydratase
MSGAALPRVGDLLAPHRFGPIGAEQVEAFAAISGDRNPIHVDAAAARRAGLDAPPVHGMQLVALMHEAAARGGADIRALATRFLSPVPVGETVEVTGRVVKVAEAAADPHAVMRLFLKRGDGSLACIGEAEIRLAGAGADP